MLSFEQEVKQLLDKNKVPYLDFSDSGSKPDLSIQLTTGHIDLELKEKRQPIRADKWPLITDEVNSFIIDEFTVRKMMTFAPWVALAIRDNTTGLYYLADIYTLVFAPRNRCNREMVSPKGDEIVNVKGKWCLDLRFFPGFDDLRHLFRAIKFYQTHSPIDPAVGVDCWNPFNIVQNIPTAGDKRSLELREHDVEATR